MTPKGQAATQDEQPLQISGWMKTLLNSVWMMAPVGQACWQGAVTQCLQTSLIMSQRPAPRGEGAGARGEGGETRGNDSRLAFSSLAPRPSPLAPPSGNCSMNFTCRQDVADSSPVLS